MVELGKIVKTFKSKKGRKVYWEHSYVSENLIVETLNR